MLLCLNKSSQIAKKATLDQSFRTIPEQQQSDPETALIFRFKAKTFEPDFSSLLIETIHQLGKNQHHSTSKTKFE